LAIRSFGTSTALDLDGWQWNNSPRVMHQSNQSPKHYCGVFGIFGHPNAAELTYYGLYALQHRGQESAGIVACDGKQFRAHKDMGLVSQVFDGDILHALVGSMAVGHTRYSTTGSSHLRNAQPLTVDCKRGQRMPFIGSMTQMNGQPTAYLCANFACGQPIADLKTLQERLAALSRRRS
jgi:glutamate synthase domain-containing protein 1